MVEEDQEPPTKRARVSEGEDKFIKVENVAALIKLERLERDQGEQADMKGLHRGVFNYLESIRKTSHFLQYVYHPGKIPSPQRSS